MPTKGAPQCFSSLKRRQATVRDKCEHVHVALWVSTGRNPPRQALTAPRQLPTVRPAPRVHADRGEPGERARCYPTWNPCHPKLRPNVCDLVNPETSEARSVPKEQRHLTAKRGRRLQLTAAFPERQTHGVDAHINEKADQTDDRSKLTKLEHTSAGHKHLVGPSICRHRADCPSPIPGVVPPLGVFLAAHFKPVAIGQKTAQSLFGHYVGCRIHHRTHALVAVTRRLSSAAHIRFQAYNTIFAPT